jgi:transcriptional regulator with XRE-family HTH domain
VTIGERLRRERVRAGLSQMEIAARLGIGRGYVYKIESGLKKPGRVLIESWARATGATHADLVLDGPALFDLAFPIECPIADPFAARRVLDSFPASGRRQVAVWPSSGEAVLRLRARGSALPMAIDLAGSQVPTVGWLGAPSVSPVRAVDALVTWVRATNERAAAEQVEERLACVAAHGKVTLDRRGRLFVARVAALSERASVALQDLVEESPIGLFVPAHA